MALTKADIALHLCRDLDMHQHQAKEMVSDFFEELRRAFEAGEEVKLSGFGNFDLRDKPERPGRNPKTGVEVPIAPRRVVTFKAGQKLRSLIALLTKKREK